MTRRKIKTITLCSSLSFYKQALAIRNELEKQGFKVRVPFTATIMEKTGDYKRSTYKTWYKDPKMFKLKARVMQKHFIEVASADAVLVINLKRKGIEGYIGGNVLMEMGLAFYLKKPIFIWNNVSRSSPFYEEIMGMLPRFLNKDSTKINQAS